jgi:uncharacterized protein (DUF1684 family)
MNDLLSLLDWRRAVASLYAEVRATAIPREAHARWRAGRDELFRRHPQSPLRPDDPLRETGLPYWPYDESYRFTVPLTATEQPQTRTIEGTSGGPIRMHAAGHVTLPTLGITIHGWWLEQYGGGLFLPLRDGTAGHESYGGGRYLLDTAKGADLGVDRGTELVIDLNFLYHPSCRYSDEWVCPLAAQENTTAIHINAGERMPAAV